MTTELAADLGPDAYANFRQRLALDQPDPTPLLGHETEGGDVTGVTGGTGRRRERAA